MVIVAVTGTEVAFVAVKAGISPDPLAARPMVVLLFVQVKVVPGTDPVTGVMAALPLLQYVWFETGFTVGSGFIVTVVVAVTVPHPFEAGTV
jgi:hypothetical protein